MTGTGARRLLAGVLAVLFLTACGGGASSSGAERARLQVALERYAADQKAFSSDLLRGLARLDFHGTHAAVEKLRGATTRFDTVVRSLNVPQAEQGEAHTLLHAERRRAQDLSRAAAASALSGIVLAIGNWSKGGGSELSAAIRLRHDLGR